MVATVTASVTAVTSQDHKNCVAVLKNPLKAEQLVELRMPNSAVSPMKMPGHATHCDDMLHANQGPRSGHRKLLLPGTMLDEEIRCRGNHAMYSDAKCSSKEEGAMDSRQEKFFI